MFITCGKDFALKEKRDGLKEAKSTRILRKLTPQ